MNLAVSSIAWTNEEEPAIAEKLRELGVKNVEIAPTKLWQNPTRVDVDEAKRYLDWWAGYGIKVSAFQSMLFTRPDLKIFESQANRQQTFEYMSKFLRLASIMGAKKLVFGSPKNRQRGDVSQEKAWETALTFFAELGGVAQKEGVILCIEPNAPQYSCDFITNAQEGSLFVRQVNEIGFGLHLDTACMALAKDNLADSIYVNKDILEHFHISSPMLEQVEARADIDHVSAAYALRDIGYGKLVSIEMRPGEPGENVARVEKAVLFAKRTYLA